MDLFIQHIDSVIPAAGGVAVILAALRPPTGWCPPGEEERRNARRRRLLRLGVMLVTVSVIYLSVSFRRTTPVKAGPPPQEWAPLIEGGRFSVLLPALRTHSQSDERSALGLIRSHKWRAGADPDRVLVIEASSRYPRTRGLPPEHRHAVHVDEIDVLVQSDEPPFPLPDPPVTDVDRAIAEVAYSLIEDGATLQTGIGAVPPFLRKENFCALGFGGGVRNPKYHTPAAKTSVSTQ